MNDNAAQLRRRYSADRANSPSALDIPEPAFVSLRQAFEGLPAVASVEADVEPEFGLSSFFYLCTRFDPCARLEVVVSHVLPWAHLVWLEVRRSGVFGEVGDRCELPRTPIAERLLVEVEGALRNRGISVLSERELTVVLPEFPSGLLDGAPATVELLAFGTYRRGG